jgi:hypothetical protein
MWRSRRRRRCSTHATWLSGAGRTWLGPSWTCQPSIGTAWQSMPPAFLPPYRSASAGRLHPSSARAALARIRPTLSAPGSIAQGLSAGYCADLRQRLRSRRTPPVTGRLARRRSRAAGGASPLAERPTRPGSPGSRGLITTPGSGRHRDAAPLPRKRPLPPSRIAESAESWKVFLLYVGLIIIEMQEESCRFCLFC